MTQTTRVRKSSLSSPLYFVLTHFTFVSLGISTIPYIKNIQTNQLCIGDLPPIQVKLFCNNKVRGLANSAWASLNFRRWSLGQVAVLCDSSNQTDARIIAGNPILGVRNIKVKTKWLPICRRQFQFHFRILIEMSLKFVHVDPIYNKSLFGSDNGLVPHMQGSLTWGIDDPVDICVIWPHYINIIAIE